MAESRLASSSKPGRRSSNSQLGKLLDVDSRSAVGHTRASCGFSCAFRTTANNGEQYTGGRGGIRTHGTLAGTPVFKTGALNHSATLPSLEIVQLFVASQRTFRGLCYRFAT